MVSKITLITNRALVFSEKFFDSNIPPIEPEEPDWTVLALAQRELSSYINAMEQAKMRDGLKHILAISKHGNQYMQFQQPWMKIKGNDDDKYNMFIYFNLFLISSSNILLSNNIFISKSTEKGLEPLLQFAVI